MFRSDLTCLTCIREVSGSNYFRDKDMVLRNVKLRSQLFNTLHAVFLFLVCIMKEGINRCKIKNLKERLKNSWLGKVHEGGEGPHWTVGPSKKNKIKKRAWRLTRLTETCFLNNNLLKIHETEVVVTVLSPLYYSRMVSFLIYFHSLQTNGGKYVQLYHIIHFFRS